MDFRLPSNRVALALPSVAGVVAGAWALAAGWGLGEAVRAGVGAGGGSFLAWATARELDPDHPHTATVAAVLAPWAVLSAAPSLAAGFVWLLAIRAMTGSTGSAPYPPDLVVVGALSVWATLGDRALVVVVTGLAVLVLSTSFDRRGRAVTVAMAVAMAAIVVAVSLVRGGPLAPQSFTAASWWWSAVMGAVAIVALSVRTVSTADRRPQPLSGTRLRWGVAAAAVFGIVMVAWHGPVGVAMAAPVAAALAAVAMRIAAGVVASRR
jgi:hypothetical protein